MTAMKESAASRFVRCVRWMLGRGYSSGDFATRYARIPRNAWNYAGDATHARRFRMIEQAIPARPVGRMLEVGCAEGDLSRILAGCAEELVACDIVPEAVARAEKACADLPNVRFVVRDVRRGLPVGPFDCIVFSDVLYYLSRVEVRDVLEASHTALKPGGHLVFANEWQGDYSFLTDPRRVVELLESSPCWRQLSLSVEPMAENATLTLGVFQRVA